MIYKYYSLGLKFGMSFISLMTIGIFLIHSDPALMKDVAKISLCCLILTNLYIYWVISITDSSVEKLNFLENNYNFINYDLKLKNFRFSLHFQSLLGLEEVHYDINILDKFVSLEDKLKFVNLINNYNHFEDSDPQTALYFNVLFNISNRKKYYKCEIRYSYGTKYRSSYLIINFIDMNVEKNEYNLLNKDFQALKSKYKVINNVLDTVPVAIWARDSELDIIYYNKSYANIISYAGENTSNNSNSEIDKSSINMARNAISNKKIFKEERYIVASSKRCLYEFIDTYNNNQIISIGYDITSKHDVQKDLARSISAQADLLESSSNACAIFGPDRKLQFYNHAYVKLWNLDENWLDTQPLFDILLDKLRNMRKLPEQANFLSFKKDQIKLFTTLTETHDEFFYLPDGRALRVIAIPHSFGGLLFSYEDMTNRIALESSYNTLVDVQKATLDNLHEGISVFGENGKLRLKNPTFNAIWKFEQEYLDCSMHFLEILDASSHFFSSIEQFNQHKGRVMSAFTNRQQITEEIQRIDGSVINRKILPLPDGSTLLTDLDMTDSIIVERSLREKNIALQDADRIKSQFLANVSYKLRSPLTSILGLSESLEKNFFGPLNRKQNEYVHGIYNSSLQLLNLINDIIELTSIDAGYVELKISEFDIYKAINSMLPLVKERLNIMKINLILECDENIGIIWGDEIRIKQAIFKLLSNAIEFSPIETSIIIRIKEETNDSISISVIDNGKGISIEDQEFIFNKFYQGSNQDNYNLRGGLGLSLVKNFIELHGGKVTFRSEINKGSEFTCIIPRGDKYNIVSVNHQEELIEQ